MMTNITIRVKSSCFIIYLLALFFKNGYSAATSSSFETHYFQQYVQYTLNVQLDINRHRLKVDEIMMYTNHSPDTLRQMYFHLYLNKYRAGSLFMPDLKTDMGGITIHTIHENDSLHHDYAVDQTLLTVVLNNPLTPGESVRWHFTFEDVIPPASDRYGYQGNHYDIGNWYITPVVYDQYGWHLHQHLDNEFYQEWADFRVNIKVPAGYIIGATGNLITTVRKDPLDSTGTDTLSTTAASNSDNMLKRCYEAKRVHDFAWTTDPSYVLMQSEWNGITINVLALDYNRDSWRQVPEWGKRAIQYYCNTFGPYPYEQITIADTYIRAGGIEYPQIVMLNDYINPENEPGEFHALLLHELAHNWFYGLLASNQTEQEWMDEGFATFAEIKALEALFGVENNLVKVRTNWIQKKTAYRDDDRRSTAYHYLRWAKRNLDQDPIALHADYLGDDGYMLEYSKMAMVLFMLEYTLGDSVFNLGMKEYFNQWCFHHPYSQDFIAVMENTAHYNLHWFFQQWLSTNRKLDYAIQGYSGNWKKIDEHPFYTYHLRLERKGEVFMPVNFDVYLKDGSVQHFHIPIDNYTQSSTTRISLPYWHFSQKKYTANLTLSSAVKSVALDSLLGLVDINSLNNYTGFLPRQEFSWMRYQSYAPPLDRYIWEVWPQFFYNDYDKVTVGIRLNGSYLNIDHKINACFGYKTAIPAVDADVSYQTPFYSINPKTWFYLRLYRLDGREGLQCGLLSRVYRSYLKFVEYGMGITSHQVFNSAYLMAPWDESRVSTLYLNYKRSVAYSNGWKNKHKLRVYTHTSFFDDRYKFSQIFLETSRTFWDEHSDWEAILRFFTGYSQGKVPAQFLFNLSGGNGWDEFSDLFYRSKGSLPYSWRRNGHLYKAGGGNVRGASLAGEPASMLDEKIISANCDIMIPNPVRFTNLILLRDLTLYWFIDAGAVWHQSIPELDQFQKTTGLSFLLPAGRWLDFLFNLKNVRLDFPVWIGNKGAEAGRDRLRWLISFNFD
jgi:hypothetical protein